MGRDPNSGNKVFFRVENHTLSVTVENEVPRNSVENLIDLKPSAKTPKFDGDFVHK